MNVFYNKKSFSLNGIGIRDYYEGGYVNLSDLNIPTQITELITDWLTRYWEAFYTDYRDKNVVENLDAEGVKIAQLVQKELGGKVWYYSDAKQQKLLL